MEEINSLHVFVGQKNRQDAQKKTKCIEFIWLNLNALVGTKLSKDLLIIKYCIIAW
jgi:hypothetical protein